MVRQVLPSPVKPDKSYKRTTNLQDVPSNPVTMTRLPQGFEQNKKWNNQPFEAGLETTKRKLQEAYLKVIEFKDLPKKDDCQKIIDRCCPKKWTNCLAKCTALPIS